MAQRSAAQEKPSHSHTDGWIRTILLNDELIHLAQTIPEADGVFLRFRKN
jgi:hypothetical protein